jgi:hypothetical protein
LQRRVMRTCGCMATSQRTRPRSLVWDAKSAWCTLAQQGEGSVVLCILPYPQQHQSGQPTENIRDHCRMFYLMKDKHFIDGHSVTKTFL